MHLNSQYKTGEISSNQKSSWNAESWSKQTRNTSVELLKCDLWKVLHKSGKVEYAWNLALRRLGKKGCGREISPSRMVKSSG